VGSVTASLPLTQVREVILPGALTRVPRAAKPILGVMNVRGRVALIVDAGELLEGETSVRRQGSERIVMLDPRRRDLGLWVSEVLSIARLEAKAAPASAPRDHVLDAETISARVAELFSP
jgi:chemotaxis signal transduction protein